jgi:hypothetical protein
MVSVDDRIVRGRLVAALVTLTVALPALPLAGDSVTQSAGQDAVQSAVAWKVS